MNLEHGAKQTTGSSQQHDETDTGLHGRWLAFARVIWGALVIPSLGLLVIATMLSATQLIGPDKAVRALMLHPDPSVSGYIATFSHIYLQVGSYLTLTVVLASLSSLVWIAVGLLIFWRKSDDWMALLVALGLITLGVAISPQLHIMNVLSEMHSLWRWPTIFVSMLGWGFLGLVLILFPDGRIVPRWMRWMVLVWIVYLVFWSLPSNSPYSTEQWPPLLNASVKLSILIAPIYTQLSRYRHTSSLIERQQTKLVVFAIVISLLADVGLYLPLVFFSTLAQPGLTRSVYEFISVGFNSLALYLIPLAIGIAVLRYRLWDIDILINRTLVYGTLTALLALVYVGLIVALQFLLRGMISQDNGVAIVLSTLVIAALFQPLRSRIQQVIDRRFYRRKYDAKRIIDAFSATLRSETDLARLSEQLVAVVQETMQPTHVSLWLRPPEHDGRHRAPWRANPPVSSEGR